jgi:DNA-binding FadR family transcriptional regulator
MEPLFREAKQNRIFQDVVEQIQEAIISGRLQKGDRLPAERELKEMLKTSRSTLREALRVLEHKGLIEIKLGMGGGAIVRNASIDQVSESLDLLIRSQQVSLNHLAEFRERVEGDVAALAATRITKKDIRLLEDLLRQAQDCVDSGVEFVAEFIEVDRKIHMAFARITGNPVYISIHRTIHNNINRYFERYLLMEDLEMKENFRDLKALVRAVAQKDAELARSIAQTHVRHFNNHMKKFEKTGVNKVP